MIGIGLNVSTKRDEFPDELRESATSLEGCHPDRLGTEAVLAAVLAALERRLGSKPGEILAAWRSRDALAGTAIRWNGGEGVAAGLDDDGSLLVDTDAGRLTLDAGEVHLLARPTGA
jgi:BirA family biotin operon repressor/biotin-[acetyl-CoA-carboxylase] ligase